RVPEVRLGEREDDVAPEGADVAGQADPLPAAEEVVLLDPGVEQERVRGAKAGARAERAGLRLLHVDDDLHAVVLGRAARGDVHLLEEAEALQRVLALAKLARREELLLLEPHLAPDDLVAGLRVPGDLDAIDDHLLAAIDLERHVDLLVLGMYVRL